MNIPIRCLLYSLSSFLIFALGSCGVESETSPIGTARVDEERQTKAPAHDESYGSRPAWVVSQQYDREDTFLLSKLSDRNFLACDSDCERIFVFNQFSDTESVSISDPDMTAVAAVGDQVLYSVDGQSFTTARADDLSIVGTFSASRDGEVGYYNISRLPGGSKAVLWDGDRLLVFDSTLNDIVGSIEMQGRPIGFTGDDELWVWYTSADGMSSYSSFTLEGDTLIPGSERIDVDGDFDLVEVVGTVLDDFGELYAFPSMTPIENSDCRFVASSGDDTVIVDVDLGHVFVVETDGSLTPVANGPVAPELCGSFTNGRGDGWLSLTLEEGGLEEGGLVLIETQ